MIRSLRLRLLIGTSLATAIVLSLLGVGIYYSMRRTLLSEFDETTLAQARALASMTENERGKMTFEFDSPQMPEFSAKVHPEYFEIWIDGAGVLARSPSLTAGDLPRPTLAGAPVFRNAPLADGREGRWVDLRFAPLIDGPPPAGAPLPQARVTVARDMGHLNHTLDRMRWLLLGLCGAATVVCGTMLLIVVGGALRPVDRLGRNIESFAETDLSHRFDLTGVPTEIAPMVDRLNGLLARLESAFGRERGFTADVAHEMRTPLAGLRTTLEVCRSRPRDTVAYESALDKCSAITERMQDMVQRLLLLARADGRQLTVRSQPVDLRSLLEDSWAQFRQRAKARGLVMQLGVANTCWIQSDADLLRIVIDNLFDNAVSYANEGGHLYVATRTDDQLIELLVSNTGSQVEAADMPKVLDRFWRGDPARADNGVHCGLGLSLCERLMRVLNGGLSVETEHDGLFVVCLQLKASPPNSA